MLKLAQLETVAELRIGVGVRLSVVFVLKTSTYFAGEASEPKRRSWNSSRLRFTV